MDSVQWAAETSLKSKSSDTLKTLFQGRGETDPSLGTIIELFEKESALERQVFWLEQQLDSLKVDGTKKELLVNQKIANLNHEIAAQKKALAEAKQAKKALMIAKYSGASLTAVSLYFQIKNIRDAIARVKIKELDLVARRETMEIDATKLDILNRKYERMRTNLESLKSTERPTAKQLAAAEEAMMDAKNELNQWQDVMRRTSQKIIDAETTARIDARSIFRQKLTVGITAIGALVISLFGDRIVLAVKEWLESDDPAEQEKEALGFLQDWHKVHPHTLQASLIPLYSRPEVSPHQKASVFFMSSEDLGLKPGVFERALARYKSLDAYHYSQLQGTAEALLGQTIQRQMCVTANRMQSEAFTEQQTRDWEWRLKYNVAAVDNTFVKTYPLTLLHCD